MVEDTDLRRLLVDFRETEIYAKWHSDPTSRKHSVLRRGMIDWLIANKPDCLDEWIMGLPAQMRRQTDPDQFREYAPQILAILRRHQRRSGPHLRIA
ncbi:hypothetical protein OEZ60_21850 [Defluviimonas sp. WL0024]|uniref:Uncharacterized protein n=1 Tax=Albidovulum salinarum TaxID=2984153 RepID=A0ABT2XG49_9RHOB|nr:hypothetical protein [Defluviimonas sp. WL0024]MCU9850615.1 hypothetical protein [Defluviimonas sp. WL0024]